MMQVMVDKEEINPSPREANAPREYQSQEINPSPIDFHSPKEFSTVEIEPSPRDFYSPKDFHTPKSPDEPELFGNNDDLENSKKTRESVAPEVNDETREEEEEEDDDGDKDVVPGNENDFKVIPGNDKTQGDDVDDNDNDNDTEIGDGDSESCDLADILLQEEEENDDLPIFKEYYNEDSEQEAVIIEMKMRKKKALLEFRCKVEDAIRGNYLLGSIEEFEDPIQSAIDKEKLRDITMWGIPLLPSKSHPGSDTVLLKFLRARDFKVDEAYDMLQKTVLWRKDMNVEGILEEELESEDLSNVAYTNSVDKDGHPLCYNLFGPFKDRELYNRTFGTTEKRDKYLRWRVQCMEKAIRQLSFRPGNVDKIVLVTDLGNSPGPAMKELRALCKQLIVLFQEYYPELVHRNLVINVPFWYYVSHVLHSRFISQRTKRRFIFARPANATDTLLKYINPENLPIEHGGLQRQNDPEFSTEDKSKHINVKPYCVGTVEIPVTEGGMTIEWDLTVVGWEVSYKEEFIPEDEGSYTVLIQRDKKLTEYARNSFHIREPGKIVLTIQNLTNKRKKVYYRSKTKPTADPMFNTTSS